MGLNFNKVGARWRAAGEGRRGEGAGQDVTSSHEVFQYLKSGVPWTWPWPVPPPQPAAVDGAFTSWGLPGHPGFLPTAGGSSSVAVAPLTKTLPPPPAAALKFKAPPPMPTTPPGPPLPPGPPPPSHASQAPAAAPCAAASSGAALCAAGGGSGIDPVTDFLTGEVITVGADCALALDYLAVEYKHKFDAESNQHSNFGKDSCSSMHPA